MENTWKPIILLLVVSALGTGCDITKYTFSNLDYCNRHWDEPQCQLKPSLFPFDILSVRLVETASGINRIPGIFDKTLTVEQAPGVEGLWKGLKVRFRSDLNGITAGLDYVLYRYWPDYWHDGLMVCRTSKFEELSDKSGSMLVRVGNRNGNCFKNGTNYTFVYEEDKVLRLKMLSAESGDLVATLVETK